MNQMAKKKDEKLEAVETEEVMAKFRETMNKTAEIEK